MGEIFKREVPRQILEFTGERLTTDVGGQIEMEHFHRYFLARSLARGLTVLDVACGEGYGSAYLSQVAESVIGVDIDAASVEHAKANYGRSNIDFRVGSALELPVPSASVDLVVSFETIEHFYDHDTFLKEVKRVLKPGGLFMVSTPERDIYSPPNTASNPYHVRELTQAEFQTLLAQHFDHTALLMQRVMSGSVLVQEGGDLQPAEALTIERRGSEMFEVSAGMPRAPYIVALASSEALPAVGPSYYLLDHVVMEQGALSAKIDQLESALAFAHSVVEERGTRIEELERVVASAAAKTNEAASHAEFLTPLNSALEAELLQVRAERDSLLRYKKKPLRSAFKLLNKKIRRLIRGR